MLTRLRLLLARVRALVTNQRQDDDFSAELQSHIELLADEHIANGVAPAEARRLAALRVGNPASLRMQHRDARGLPLIDDLWLDLRFAMRLIVKDRWFSAVAVAAIALGIGANTLGFTIVNAAFLRGFSFDQADRLHAVSWRHEQGRRIPLSFADFEDWRAQTRSFTALAAYSFGAVNISDDHAAPDQTQGSWISANHFEVLRQQTLLGRAFAAGEDHRGAEPVVIIGYEIWKNRFGRDPNAVGRVLRINGRAATIIGVMPERMKFPENSELWMPFVPTDAQLARDARILGVFGRLADGATKEAADDEIDGIARRTIAANAEQTGSLAGGRVETFLERFLGGAARPMFITVMGAVMFVLLIACANVASLLLSRTMYRTREVAVRYSLGATRWRVVRQLLIESITLSTMGGMVGLVLASVAVQSFDAAVQMSQPPYWLRFTIDYRVLAYVAGICVATGVLFGLAPALHVSRDNQNDTLKEGARGCAGNRRASRFGNGLVVVELALTAVLLCGAGLMLRSFAALNNADPGFNIDGLVRLRMQLPPANYPTPDARLRFFEQLQPLVEAIPGVQQAAVTTSVPPLADGERRLEINGQPLVQEESRPFVATVTITPGYFAVLGVAINRGRAFTAADGGAGAETVIISPVMAERYFAGEDPIGRQIRLTARREHGEAPQPWRTIVGVSASMRQGSPDEAFRSAVVYLPFRQSPPRTASLLILSTLPPASVMTAVRAAVQSIDADQPVFPIQTLAQAFAEERIIFRIFSTLFAVLGAIALLLSAVGIYGVMAYAVTHRTQEIGVRMAIGAQRWQVSWLFMKRALLQLAVGLALGVPAALALARLARFRLIEVEPNDPVTLAGIVVILGAVSLAASVLPVRRAARVDPAIALRSE
jgi:predicted permease